MLVDLFTRGKNGTSYLAQQDRTIELFAETMVCAVSFSIMKLTWVRTWTLR